MRLLQKIVMVTLLTAIICIYSADEKNSHQEVLGSLLEQAEAPQEQKRALSDDEIQVLNGYLFFAVGLRRVEDAGIALRDGADVNVIPQWKPAWTPLMCAIHNGDSKMVRFLLDHGAGVQIKDTKGETSISLAHKFGRVDIIEMLRNHEHSLQEPRILQSRQSQVIIVELREPRRTYSTFNNRVPLLALRDKKAVSAHLLRNHPQKGCASLATKAVTVLGALVVLRVMQG